jgi:epoxyqueuosine reductase QueG
MSYDLQNPIGFVFLVVIIAVVLFFAIQKIWRLLIQQMEKNIEQKSIGQSQQVIEQKESPSVLLMYMEQEESDIQKLFLEFCKNQGVDLIGFADLNQLKGKITTYPSDLLEPYCTGISIALRLNDAIIDKIITAPTSEYADHYREINIRIDKILEALAKWIEEHNGHVFIVPASKIMKAKDLAGHISHKAVARHPTEGPRIRFGTLLTDLKFRYDSPMENSCGSCSICSQACPVQAIYDVNTPDYYNNPNDAIDLERCFTQCKIFRDMPGIRATICGICMRACPYGQK